MDPPRSRDLPFVQPAVHFQGCQMCPQIAHQKRMLKRMIREGII